MTDVELAWLAGLLEGEGCFGLDWLESERAMLAMTDKDVVLRVARLLDVAVFPTVRRTTTGKEVWRVRIGRRTGVIPLISALRPYMGERRQVRIDEMLAADAAHPSQLTRWAAAA